MVRLTSLRHALAASLRRLRRRSESGLPAGEAGNIMIMMGLAAVVLFGIMGLAIDIGRLYATKAELSRAVDAAALAGVLEFDGTPAGLALAQTRAEAYLVENEPGLDCPGAECDVVADDGQNKLTVDATKSVKMFFLSVFGIDSANVDGHAVAGFNNQTIDAVLVLDSTGSMTGDPITQAKIAAGNFKNVLLGTSPSGNVVVGVAPFRGCYRASSPSATAPKPNSQTNCVSQDSEVTDLMYDSSTLSSRINALCPGGTCAGGSGTNVANGVLKGWEVLDGPNNHVGNPNNSRYMILLSDGDNRYTGTQAYQASPVSPHTYRGYPSRPPLSCSNVGGDSTGSNPCVSAVVAVVSDNFSSCSSWSGGSGWSGAWTRSPSSGNDAPALTSSGSPYDTSCHARLRGVGSITRVVDFSDVTSATLTYYAKRGGWESGDQARVQVSTDGTNWTTLRTHTTSNTGTSYSSFTSNLNAYAGEATVYLRFLGAMTPNDTGDQFYVDAIVMACQNGALNCDDNSSSCGSAVKRERQLDMLTWDAAKAIEADGAEIFVVGFGVCDPTSSPVYSQSQCDSQIGNTDADSVADERLLKCIASSDAGTNDHYFYAASASALPAIFSTIAAQIAHRLIE